MKKKIIIEGMQCEHCVGHVREALINLEGSSNVEVNLDGKYAILDTDASDEKIKEVIEDEGYDVVSISNN